MNVSGNLEIIRKDIRNALFRCGDPGRQVSIIAATKGRSEEQLREAAGAGLHEFGENYVAEFLHKYELFSSREKFHFIGHLQRNKVKKVVGRACMIQSLDSMRLAEAVDTEALKQGIVQQVLVEVNIGGEASKYGVDPQEACAFIEGLERLNNLRVMGLMGMAPFIPREETRPFFKTLHRLFIIIKNKQHIHAEMKYLSMGMSGDYVTAVEEGSNMLRLGTRLFEPGTVNR